MARVLGHPSFDIPEAAEGTGDQWRLWSDCESAQSDQSLRWWHKSYCRFCRALAHMLMYTSHLLRNGTVDSEDQDQPEQSDQDLPCLLTESMGIDYYRQTLKELIRWGSSGPLLFSYDVWCMKRFFMQFADNAGPDQPAYRINGHCSTVIHVDKKKLLRSDCLDAYTHLDLGSSHMVQGPFSYIVHLVSSRPLFTWLSAYQYKITRTQNSLCIVSLCKTLASLRCIH